MKALRIVFGVFLLLIALTGSIGEIIALAGSHPFPWYSQVSDALICGILFCWSGLLIKPPRSADQAVCSHCGTETAHTQVASFKDRSINRIAGHFGGIILAAFYHGSRKRRFRCTHCQQIFYSDTAVSKTYRLLFILFTTFILFRTWFELFGR